MKEVVGGEVADGPLADDEFDLSIIAEEFEGLLDVFGDPQSMVGDIEGLFDGVADQSEVADDQNAHGDLRRWVRGRTREVKEPNGCGPERVAFWCRVEIDEYSEALCRDSRSRET